MFVESGVISRIWNVRFLQIKVAALRLFPPTVSSVLFEPGFYYYDTISGEEGKGEGVLTVEQ
jgi:hypothetical protein